ncbi:hypothetical protein LAZ67_X002444 [Cordylochernes scorpioides]|uniref:Reverse transcriptase n=1 Tax=Cordylochernes scorpioides TaxID=51811 RepID=A0ABY6LXI8_9ARAC|nr:hypothetical protein LAZ67_X002444 [Cordylochernes scorpioides]
MTFCIQEQSLAIREEDTYCHLGGPTGHRKFKYPEETIMNIKEDLEKIYNSLLDSWQMIDATKTFIYPRLDFIIRGSPIQKTSFKEVDLLIRRLGKKWLGLLQRASNEVLFIPSSKGRAGIVPFGDWTDFSKIQHAFRSLLKELRRNLVCGQADEMLPYVLQHYRKHSAAVNKRHHNIVERLKKASRLHRRTRINQRVPEIFSNPRPDVVVTEEDKKRVTIIEMAKPFKNHLVAFKDAKEEENIQMYSPCKRT